MVLSIPPQGPEQYRIAVETTAGRFEIDVRRAWSPFGADRFLELLLAQYYDDSRFFRVVAGKWAMFGIAGDPTVTAQWRHRTIPDDRLVVANTLGYIGYANTGPETRAAQVYINLGDNSELLDDKPGFSPFGLVVAGMDVVQKLYSGHGENSGGALRDGGQQELFDDGNRYLDTNFPELDRLIRMIQLA